MVPPPPDARPREDAPIAGKAVDIEVNGHVQRYAVFPDPMQAVEAAQRLCVNARSSCTVQIDAPTGLKYCPVLEIDRVIHLDDDVYFKELGRHTWLAALDAKVGADLANLIAKSDAARRVTVTEAGGTGYPAKWELVPLPGDHAHKKAASRPSSKPRANGPSSKPPAAHPRSKSNGVARPSMYAESKAGKKADETDPLWGKTYIQRGQGGPGVASFHFDTAGEASVSYESAPASWVMDDGTKYPRRLTFTNSSYEARTRTFRGTLEWHPRTVRSTQTWVYEMVFGRDFKRIVGGHVHMYATSAAKEPAEAKHFGEDVHYELWNGAAKKKSTDFDYQEKQIIDILGLTLEKNAKATGGKRPSPNQTMQLVFGDAMRTYARDVEADRKIMAQRSR